MKKQRLGELLEFIMDNNYSIFGVFSIHMTVPMIEEFFDIYRNVFVNYSQCLEHFADGPCVAIGIMGNYLDEDWSSKYHRPATSGGSDVVSDFREFVGPQNPELARMLRPKSLRATFGDTSVQNAVHCTDLPTDGEMECRYFFETLANLK
jgi:nucleoside-diphosphate kinase